MRIVLDKTKCKECGASITQSKFNNRWYCGNRCRVLAHQHRNPRKQLLKRAQYRSKQKDLAFDLSLEDIPEIPTYCPVLGIKMNINKGSGLHPSSVSLNRLDPSKGYIKGNIEIISQRANHLLSNATTEELELVLEHARSLRR